MANPPDLCLGTYFGLLLLEVLARLFVVLMVEVDSVRLDSSKSKRCFSATSINPRGSVNSFSLQCLAIFFLN